MKLLRNAWVSGALALVAVVVVVYQFAPLRWAKAEPAPVPPPATTPIPAPAASVAHTDIPTNASAVLPPLAVERAVVESQFAHWAEAPRRDPFWLLPARAETAVHRYPSPVLAWKLKAIWRQTDGRVAAIDNRIYAEGDNVHGYRILKIDADQVVFEGPDGPEVLTFTATAATRSATQK